MFPRRLTERLISWSEKPNHKPLVLRGARQVGKTSLVMLISKSFDRFIHLNLDKKENKDQRNQMLKRIPAGRFGEAEDVAGLALFLAGNDSDFINGVAIPLDGGKIIMP